MRAAVEEPLQSVSAFAALGEEGRILSDDKRGGRRDSLGNGQAIELRESKRLAELAVKSALRIGGVAGQVAEVDPPAQRQNGGKESKDELALWLAQARHLV